MSVKASDILNPLLVKYEKSTHLVAPGQSNRRVLLQVKNKEVPFYDYENAVCRDAVNEVVRALEAQAVIGVKWASSYVFETLWLRLENIAQAYQLCDKVTPQKQVQACVANIQCVAQTLSTDWILAWCEEICAKMEKTLKVSGICAEEEGLSELLRAFQVYDALPEEGMTMRAFSARCYQDTKKFEKKYRDHFVKIAEKYHVELRELCDEALAQEESFGVREKLALLGIYAGAELYEFAGDITVHTKQGDINTAALAARGIALPSTNVPNILQIDLNGTKQITFIENKTNYEAYLLSERKENELAVFHGGFSSPQKRRFIAKIQESIEKSNHPIACYLWSDIDFGGFQMFYRLREIIADLQPLHMAKQDVERFKGVGLKRNTKYLARLEQILEAGSSAEFEGAIQAILEHKVTIEQEVFLFDDYGVHV